MGFKWREDHTPTMLDLLKSRECLWNNKLGEYKSKSARENALQDFLEELNLPGVTVGDVRSKLKSIRTRYAAELSKVQKSENSGVRPEDVYVPQLFWFKQADSFLRAVCVPRTSASDYVVKRRPNNFIIIEDDDEEVNVNLMSKEETENERRKVEKRVHPKSSVENALNKLQKLSPGNNSPENEFDVFCRSLAIQLTNMPLERALVCQEELQSVMVQERLYQIRNLTNSTSPSSSDEGAEWQVRVPNKRGHQMRPNTQKKKGVPGKVAPKLLTPAQDPTES